MFVRVKTTPNSPRKSVQIVSSYRKDGKVKQKIVRHIGIAMDDDELEKLKDLAEIVKAKLEDEIQPKLFKPEEVAKQAIKCRKNNEEENRKLIVDLKDLKEESRVTVGIHDIFSDIHKDVGFDKVLPDRKIRSKSSEILKDIILARIARPDSKRSSVKMLNDDFGKHIPLTSVYRMMDMIDDKAVENIKEQAQLSATKLFGNKVNVLFYDATTLYFESFTEDDLKKNGYSKDLKFNQPQIILTLTVTKEGIPLGYDVFEGSTFEGDTLSNAIDQIKRDYAASDVTFVADAAMLSKKNMELLEENNIPYIVGARLKNTTKHLQKEITNRANYVDYSDLLYSTGDVYNKIADFKYLENKRLIVACSIKRAKKDAEDRKKAIERIEKKLLKSSNPLEFISNYGYKRFLKKSETSSRENIKLELDEKKLKEAAEWDGLHGVVTNIKDMTAEEIREQYHGLWQVEESFRISKTDLKIRPIYHFTPKRVKAHVAICFMALVMLRHMMYRIKIQYKPMSAKSIRNNLLGVQLSILKDSKTQKRYGIPSNFTPEAEKLYKILGKKLNSTPFEII